VSRWRGVRAAEIIAACIWMGSNRRLERSLFHSVRAEADLRNPVVEWLRGQGLEPYTEVKLGTRRIDAVGFKEGGWFSSERLVGVEFKNDLEEMKRGLDQMTTFASYLSEVWLACTPAMAAEYVSRHANAPNVMHWDPEVLNEKLRRFRFGLLLVMGDDVVPLPGLEAPRSAPADAKRREVLAGLNSMSPVGPNRATRRR
jgi:hypothetical protein